jgi:metal-responsive CopG/Arc/MetJ family transcriptional regulator
MARINVNLPTQVYNDLRTTAQDSGMDMSEFVRQALRVMNTLQQEKQEGNRVYIGKDNKAEKELILP